MRVLVTLVALAMACTACGGATTRVFAVGRYAEPPEALFRSIEQSIAAQGYPITSSDAARGTITTQTNWRARSGQQAMLTVQCFRDGWVQISLSGPNVRPVRDELHVPGALRDEYEAFVVRLSESGPTREGTR